MQFVVRGREKFLFFKCCFASNMEGKRHNLKIVNLVVFVISEINTELFL